ncbi:MAG TPA: prepilin peptidase [Candidatus Methylomirabilis sp.]|nr:prepilin peptidase [Candidatus Methylomirabilis sp.]
MVALPFIFGLVIGSFLNVVIARLPEGRSVWRPRSACLGCGTPIDWYDNIPIVSFVVLGGRCRACGMAISRRYPIVEAATGLLFALAFLVLGPTPEFAVVAVLLAALVAITAIDLSHQIIPDVITLPGIVAGVVASLAIGRVTWLESLIGIAAGGGLFLVIILASGGGMGGGDMKLGAMLGAFLGWKLGLLAILLGVLSGGVVAICLLLLRRKGRKEAIPFGPFLALGGAVTSLWGEALLRWYLGHF